MENSEYARSEYVRDVNIYYNMRLEESIDNANFQIESAFKGLENLEKMQTNFEKEVCLSDVVFFYDKSWESMLISQFKMLEFSDVNFINLYIGDVKKIETEIISLGDAICKIKNDLNLWD